MSDDGYICGAAPEDIDLEFCKEDGCAFCIWATDEEGGQVVKELRERIAEMSKDKKVLLVKYSEYLEKCGYLDCDWWAEQPGSVDRFLGEA